MRVIEPVKFRTTPFTCECLAGVVNQVFDDTICLQLLRAVLQILPHKVLLEGEDTQVDLLKYLPLCDFSHCQSKRLENLGNIDPFVIGGNDIQARNPELKVVPEQLQQCWIDDGFVIVPTQTKARANRLALQGDGNEQDGG